MTHCPLCLALIRSKLPYPDRPGTGWQIDVRPIKEAMRTLEIFNALDLANVKLYDESGWIDVDPALVERFKITGLSNKDFIDVEYWKPENHRDLMAAEPA